MFKVKTIENEDYYKKNEFRDVEDPQKYNSENGINIGEWIGSGSRALNFPTDILDECLNKFKKGFHPSTNDKLFTPQKVKNNAKKNPYFWTDGTAGTVKDFGIIFNIDDKNREVYEKAVDIACDEVVKEAEKLAYRTINYGKEKKRGRKYDVKLVVAKYKHYTSREAGEKDNRELPDMQVHVHMLFAKQALTDDGMKAVDNYFLLNHQMHLGLIFRASIAKSLTEIGFEIEKTRDFHLVETKKGGYKKEYFNSFKVKGISEEVVNHFSKRRNQILKRVKELGLDGSSIALNYVAHTNRNSKRKLDKSVVVNHWKKELLKFNIDEKYIDGLKTFSKESALKNILTYEEVIESSKNINGLVTMRNLDRRLLEQQQITGISATKIKEHIFKLGLLKPTKYEYHFIANLTNDNEVVKTTKKQWLNMVKTDFNKSIQVFNYNFKNSSEVKFNLTDYFIVQNNNTRNILKKKLKNNKNESPKVVGNNLFSRMESIGLEIGRLEQSINNPDVSIEEKFRIQAMIDNLKLEYEELQKQYKLTDKRLKY